MTKITSQMVIDRAERVAAKQPDELSNRFAFYGSLRKPLYNYKRVLGPLETDGGLEFEGTTVLTGFKMFSLGYYPFIVRTDLDTDTIIVELYKVNNEYAKHHIHMMEVGAGYEVVEVVLNDKTYGIYVYPGDAEEYEKHGTKVVTGGDWVEFDKTNKL
jgi:Uncharacterized conserved protein